MLVSCAEALNLRQGKEFTEDEGLVIVEHSFDIVFEDLTFCVLG